MRSTAKVIPIRPELPQAKNHDRLINFMALFSMVVYGFIIGLVVGIQL